jgi:hypothetical protein
MDVGGGAWMGEQLRGPIFALPYLPARPRLDNSIYMLSKRLLGQITSCHKDSGDLSPRPACMHPLVHNQGVSHPPSTMG